MLESSDEEDFEVIQGEPVEQAEQKEKVVVGETYVPAKKYPGHWVRKEGPPTAQTKDFIELPGGYGMGSSTLANWI